MNDEAARQGRPATTPTAAEISTRGGTGPDCRVIVWTDADQAELDVLVWTLVDRYFEHRELCVACTPGPCPRYEAWLAHEAGCRPCQQLAPLTFGPPCPERRRFLDEHGECVRCLPCAHLQAAIREVVDWREARLLLSTAEALREAAS